MFLNSIYSQLGIDDVLIKVKSYSKIEYDLTSIDKIYQFKNQINKVVLQGINKILIKKHHYPLYLLGKMMLFSYDNCKTRMFFMKKVLLIIEL